MKAWNLFALLIVVPIAVNDTGWACDKGSERTHRLIDDIESNSRRSGFIEIAVNNSQVRVRTKVIDEIVAAGLPTIPDLLKKMQDGKTSFDGFTRCYSACEQILQNQGMKGRVLWYGGGGTADGHRLVPGGQMDLGKFQADVINDIRRKYDEIVQKQKDK